MSGESQYDSFDKEVITRLTRIETKMDGLVEWKLEHERQGAVTRAKVQEHENLVQRSKGVQWLLGVLWGILTVVVGWLWNHKP